MLPELNQVHVDQMPAGDSPRHKSHLRVVPPPPPSPPTVTRPEKARPRSKIAGLLDRVAHNPHGYDPGAYDLSFTKQVAEKGWQVFGPGRYFDTHTRGFDNIPKDRPVMMVCNHSGGTIAPDVWGLGLEWYRHFGFSRPLYILAHEMIFTLPFFARQFEKIGALRASQDVARRIVESGRDILVYPGGDRDVWRPYSKRWKVDFYGRTGFAKLAKEMDMPIVPVAHAGSHEGMRVLTDGQAIAQAVGLKRICRVQIWPIALMLPWGLALGPLPHLPPPGRYRYLVGETLSPNRDPGSVALDAQHAVQRQLTQLEREG